MAEFAPFAGLHYDPTKVNVADVLCPPYDVIKGQMRDDLIARSPYNIVQVELPEATASGSSVQGGEAEKYEAAASTLKQWRESGVLVKDDPAFYAYEQEFAVPSSGEIKKRRGVLGALRLEEFGDTVKPHEHTLSGPKEDRLKLLRATHTNTSPIFSLYDDSDGWVERLLETICDHGPLLEARDENDIIHRLWRVTDDESVNAIVAALEDESVFIADGHHRYETALNYRNERRQAVEASGGTWNGSELENWVMMMCVSTSDDGLVVLPTHRVATGLSTDAVSRSIESLEEHFEVELVATESNAEVQAQELMARVNADSPRPRLGVHIAGQSYVVTLREGDAYLNSMEAGRSAAYNTLDVSVLHTLIMEHLLGIDAAALAAGGHVAYTIDAAEAIGKVNRGEGQIAFLMRPTLVSQVQSVAAEGDKMPQKSTYFYPKVITGLVLRPLN
jgi:uncharacterized protein (DUF1015 family)